MSKLKGYSLLAAGLIALAACAPKAPDTAADEAALKAEPGAWMDAYNAGNADAVANLYTEDAVLMPPGTAAITGPAAIKDFIASDIPTSKAAGLSFKNGEATGVGVSGDMGWLSGTFSVTNASGATVDSGKYLSVFRRVNGGWKLIRDIWNSDAPPAAAPAATAAPPAG
jgi:ketosteroid isomerase-like protein